jgi:[ribosomal protein S18]-alanine N-acetyltransferase
MIPAIGDADVSRSVTSPANVRPARDSDLPRIVEIEKASFADPWGLPDFRAVLASDPAIFLVAVDAKSQQISGYVIAITVLDESEILNIAVDPEFRGSGLGASLLDAALAEVAEKGAVATFLEVRESNTVARKLYSSRQFEMLSLRKKYYKSPVEDALILRRALQR